MAQIRLLSTTLILTILIWASADSLVTEEAAVSVGVQLVPSPEAQSMIVTIDGPPDAVEVKVSGPRRSIESLQLKGARRIRIPVSDRPTGRSAVTLDRLLVREALAEQSREFDRLAVVAVQPESLPVLVDHKVTRDVDVTLKRLQMSYEVDPQLLTSRVKVQMRESVLAGAPNTPPSSIDISADLEKLLREQPMGKPLTVAVVLDKKPFGPDADINPPAVEVTAVLKSRRAVERIPTVPVLLATSFANLQRPFSAVARDGTTLTLVTQTILVAGPAEEVARLLRGETRAYGLIQLKEDDFEQMGAYKLLTPDYHLPKGIELAEEPAPIEFKLVYVSDAPGGS